MRRRWDFGSNVTRDPRYAHALQRLKAEREVAYGRAGGREGVEADPHAVRSSPDLMRIGTWNVEYGAGRDKNARRLARLHAMSADVWILTETNDALDLGADYRSVTTTPRVTARGGGRWTTVWSRLPIARARPAEDPNRAVAALTEGPRAPLLVYGVVLPWNGDRGPGGDAKGWTEFMRVVPMHAREWARRRSGCCSLSPACRPGGVRSRAPGARSVGSGSAPSLSCPDMITSSGRGFASG